MRAFVALLLLAAFTLAEKPPDYTAKNGARKVVVVKDFALPDRSREMKLSCRATFPEGTDKLPVIVFSHGLYGSKKSYVPLTGFYASHGYAVIQVSHPDSLDFGYKNRQRAIADAWRERPRQISLVISSFAAIGKAIPALKDRLDIKRVAVAGHSFGAHTSQAIGGLDIARGVVALRDTRVKCVVCISPQGEGRNLKKDAWKTFRTPAMFLTGSKDASPLENGKGGEWRRGAYENAPAGDKYLIWIDGAEHGFGGISGARWRGAGKANPDHVRIVKKTTLAFLDAYVRKDKKAIAYLASTGPVHAGKKTCVTYERK